MRWRTKRKLIYTALALLPLVIIAGVVYMTTFFPEPTCFDGEQNGNETGIDCGGDCAAVCQAQTPAADIVWDRAFQVSGDIYNVAAYIQNPNTDLIAYEVPYRFQIYDQDNILITERRGTMTLLPQPTMLAFSGGIDTNGRVPSRVVFSFSESPYWEQAPFTDVRFPVTNRSLRPLPTPELTLEITNQNQQRFSDIQLSAVVFNQSGEAVHVSQTVIGSLDVGQTASAIFTWRQPFPAAEGYRSEIIPTNYRLAP